MDSIVIVPGHVTEVASRRTAKLRRVADALVPKLRALLEDDVEDGVKQRALYALVRLEGADVPAALASLESKSGASQQAVLCALTDPDPTGVRPSATLPASFAPAIQRLCRRGQSPGASTDRPRLFENPFWDRREALKRALDAARG